MNETIKFNKMIIWKVKMVKQLF